MKDTNIDESVSLEVDLCVGCGQEGQQQEGHDKVDYVCHFRRGTKPQHQVDGQPRHNQADQGQHPALRG